MSQPQQTSVVVRTAGAVLTLCSLGLLFVLSRQSAPPASMPITPTPAVTPTPSAAATSPAQSLESRLDALDQKVEQVRQRTGEPTVPATPRALASRTPSGQRAPSDDGAPRGEIATYLSQVDAIVGASALLGPLPITAKLLERGMTSEPAQADLLIEQTNQAKAQLAALTPPAEAKEHQTLLLGQLSEAVVLLREVKVADAQGDTTRLAALAESSLRSQDQASRLFALDRTLRKR